MGVRPHRECYHSDVLKAVSEVTGIKARYLADPDCMDDKIAAARTICYRMSRDYTGDTYAKIGKFYGKAPTTLRKILWRFNTNIRSGKWSKRKAQWVAAQRKLDQILHARRNSR